MATKSYVKKHRSGLHSFFSFNHRIVSFVLGGVTKDPADNAESSCTLTMSSDDFIKMFKGELNSMQAFMTGKLKIQGDMSQALKLEKLMKTVQSKSKL